MRVGFTGTRQEMTCEQFSALCRVVQTFAGVAEWHHGCCVGADAEGVEVANQYAPGARVVAHPPANAALVSLNTLDFSDERRDPLPYLDRNRAIVDACDVLVACPKGPEERRSGTCAPPSDARSRDSSAFWKISRASSMTPRWAPARSKYVRSTSAAQRKSCASSAQRRPAR